MNVEHIGEPIYNRTVTTTRWSSILYKTRLKIWPFSNPIHEADKEKTAFVTQDGLWELNVLPQGIMNGPPIFQRIMHNLIGYGRWNYVMFYLDDILIFSRTFDEHNQYLNEILSILHTASVQINPDKCSIAVPEIDFSSHTINERHIKPNGDKIKAITDLPPPHTLKETNEFLGKIIWYRKSIGNFTFIAASLHKVTNKTKSHRHEFFWGPDQQQSFEQFKRILTTSPLFLEYPDSSTPFILTTDDSDVGIGGILRQENSTSTKINYFESRILNDIERKYGTFEKEALAIYWCISELRSYIGDSQFIIETVHKPLENFRNKQINNKRVMNWLFKLQDILPQIIAVKYRKAANNTAVDYISRHFPCNNIEIACSPSSNASYNTSPFGSPLWFGKSSKPQGAQIIKSDSSHNMLPHDIAVNIQVNAITTRAQVERLPPSSSITTSSTTPLPPHPSNSPPTDSLLDFSLNRFKSAQDQDSAIQSIIQHIRNNTNKQPFLLHNDLFYKLVPRPVIFGIDRTWHTLKNLYFWPHMKQTIAKYIQSCTQCSKLNITRRKPPGLLQPIEPPNEVFQILGLDWWGPTTPSHDGNRYVLVITDRLSGYVIAKASPTNTAQDTARILMEEIILVHGPPDVIITDQGTHCSNELITAVSNLVGCKHVFSTPYHPQTNGQTERWNATFVAQIAKFCNDEHDN
ncbi:unnamed protein product [Rotaria magnacalcarata]|uniref:Uncharacterized protein n=1 Tax=Rotaria magnacalcarata TaxID=392030 RepID=A0A816PX88_9BILA|nr:unnamed protein product [Rotaria magnacalcarata]